MKKVELEKKGSLKGTLLRLFKASRSLQESISLQEDRTWVFQDTSIMIIRRKSEQLY